jgi:aconitate hydratase
MEPRFLGVRAVLVKSFARIHETNLKKQGVLALTFARPADYDLIREDDRIALPDAARLAPGQPQRVVLRHSDGTTDEIWANHTYNPQQVSWFLAGSALNAQAGGAA